MIAQGVPLGELSVTKTEFNGIGGLRTYNQGGADMRHFSPYLHFGLSSPPRWGRFFG
jgi:hypothetical protein